ncbi:MAG: pyridoxal phosphate-dependent aminotransferase [Flavobacteriales bacterium]|nr:pyridoxal phosphate-dependent aminotransferase [Flavobacteriales bacterium]
MFMERLANRMQALSESQTIAMARKARELAEQGVDVISLSLGQPDFKTPDVIKQAAKKAIDDDFTFYTHVSGYQELREAIAGKLKRDNNLNYKASQIVVSTGAKQSIANVVMCLINPGDEVVVPAPYWVSYIEVIKLAEGTPVIVKSGIENDFKITAAQLEESITPKTRLLIFSSPCNPTGSLYTKEELKAMADVLAKHPDVFVISDEIYEYINFSGKHESIAQFDNIRDRVIIINGCSKGYSMTGWRLGYIAAPEWIAKACDKMQGQITSATCSIGQKAAQRAVEMDPSELQEMVDTFRKRRDLVLELVKEIPGMKANKPEGAFYLFPEISDYFGKSTGNVTINDANDLCMYLLEEAHVAAVPGDAFGAPEYIRLSYATSEDKLRDAFSRLKNALSKLS